MLFFLGNLDFLFPSALVLLFVFSVETSIAFLLDSIAHISKRLKGNLNHRPEESQG